MVRTFFTHIRYLSVVDDCRTDIPVHRSRYLGYRPSGTLGVWITLLAVPAGHIWYGLAAFVLFRFFDILKPLGIRRMENLPGGVGVMMDDVLAGVYGFIVLIVARWLME